MSDSDSPRPLTPGLTRQMEIYLGGLMGERPEVPADAARLRAKSEAALGAESFAYLDGGAGAEATMAANRAALDRPRIIPRMLVDVAGRDCATEVLGQAVPAPVLLAPIGVQELFHAEADKASARAAAAMGVPVILSSQASFPMETIAEEMDAAARAAGRIGAGETAPRWFQLYWGRAPELTESFVARAEACGCAALVVTLDTAVLGWRGRDLDLAALPFMHGQGIAQYTSDPVFRKSLSAAPEDDVQPAVQRFFQVFSNPSLTWADLAWLKARTRMPILLKGIQHSDDARLARDHGMAGIIVSNHGGRQVDGALGSADALPDIAAAVGGEIEILFDSGIRGGADVFKALALGASAVCLGRPFCYGLSLAGEAGVVTVLKNLIGEFDLTMGLSGCAAVNDITADRLACQAG